MSRQALEHQARVSQQLQGMRCSQVSVGADEALILDFGTLREMPDGQMAGTLALAIECPWRIDSPETAVIGWEDDDEDIVQFATVLIDAAVDEVEIRRPGFDLILRFTNEHSLRIFPDCRAYYDDAPAGERLPWQIAGDPTLLVGGD